jgi:hypothetical protein
MPDITLKTGLALGCDMAAIEQLASTNPNKQTRVEYNIPL